MSLERRFGIGGNVKTAALSAGDSDAPVWNVIMPAGEWHRSDWGVMKCDRAFFQACIDNWKKIGSPELPIDRFHWGSSNEKEVTDPKAKAAVGWMKDFRINAGGDLEALTAWLPEGREDIKAGRYKYFSPEWHENAIDKATGKRQGPTLFRGSLLNDPYFLGALPPLAANDVPSKESTMLQKLIALYGLKADATEADVEAAAKKAADAAKAAADADAVRTASEKRTGELETELKKARETNEAQEKRLAALEADVKKAADAKLQADIDGLCAKLEREGRIVAAEKEDVALDVRTFGLEKASARYAKRQPVVKLAGNIVPADLPAGDMKPEEAHRQLEQKAAEIAKANAADAPRAFVIASQQNPELARAASRLSVGTENRTH